MATYGQPRRLNSVTIVMLLGGLAAGYWLWRYFPVYFDGWTVDHILKETASSTYKLARMGEPQRTTSLKALLDKARNDIITQANVHDPELDVHLDLDGDIATVSADYTVTITHPLFDKQSKLHFHRVESENIKKVQWE